MTADDEIRNLVRESMKLVAESRASTMAVRSELQRLRVELDAANAKIADFEGDGETVEVAGVAGPGCWRACIDDDGTASLSIAPGTSFDRDALKDLARGLMHLACST